MLLGKSIKPVTFISLFFYYRYTFSSVESQIRLLGDYAFMLRDYELALSNYRLLSTDYKLDKAWKRFAGVQVKINIFFMEFLYGYFPFKVLVFGLGTSAIYIHGCEFSLYEVSECIIIFGHTRPNYQMKLIHIHFWTLSLE